MTIPTRALKTRGRIVDIYYRHPDGRLEHWTAALPYITGAYPGIVPSADVERLAGWPSAAMRRWRDERGTNLWIGEG